MFATVDKIASAASTNPSIVAEIWEITPYAVRRSAETMHAKASKYPKIASRTAAATPALNQNSIARAKKFVECNLLAVLGRTKFGENIVSIWINPVHVNDDFLL